MKYISIIILSLFINTAFAQSDCRPYVPINKGDKWEITNYTTKGKESGKAAYELLDRVDSESGTVFKIKSALYDKKGKLLSDNEFEALCVDGKFKMDMTFRMNEMSMESMEGMEIDINASDMEIPSISASVGETLDDASLVINATTNSVGVFTMTVLISERNVEAKETKTTAAGTFDCLVLYQKISTKMMMTVESYSREWYSPEVGMVRSESYNKNGKLSGYSELTKLEKS